MRAFILVYLLVHATTALGLRIDDATREILEHTEPKFRNTFSVFSDEELRCLSLNVYHEARNESLGGKVAVILVVMNRVADPRFPETICGVVMEGPHYLHKTIKKEFPYIDRCQFSWYCDGLSDAPLNRRAWIYSQALSGYFLKRVMSLIDFTEGATHYHADYIDPPFWTTRNDYVRTLKIDTHVFYRWNNG